MGSAPKRTKIINQASPQFNPGGAGGYIQKKGASRKKKPRVKISKAFRKAVTRVMQKKLREYELLSRIKRSLMFAVFTSATLPIIPASSTIASDYVGWYAQEFWDNAYCKALIDDTYRRDAYTVSGTPETRLVPFGNTGGGSQKEFKFGMTSQYRFKNNTSQSLILEVFEVVCKMESDNTPISELNQRYQDNYVASTGVIAGTDPQVLGKSFNQGWSTPGSNNNACAWKKKKGGYKIVLNPGDEGNVGFKHSLAYQYASATTTYCKGSYAVIFRIQGSISNSAADARDVHFSEAVCSVHHQYTVTCRMRDAVFHGQDRISSNLHDAFSDDVVAGDSTQHVAAS